MTTWTIPRLQGSSARQYPAHNKTEGDKIGFLAGVQDPFYFTMQRGAKRDDRSAHELVVQIPKNWNVTDQTPMLDAMVARGDLNFLFLAPVDKDAMIAPLKKANDAGLPSLRWTPSSAMATMPTAQSSSRSLSSPPTTSWAA